MVEVNYMARLGNNLFQYCFGRIVAEGLGYQLKADEIEGFPKTKENVVGLSFNDPVEIIEGQSPNLNSILSNRNPRKIQLNGWFQNIDFYIGRQKKIRQWLEIGSEYKQSTISPDADDIVVNVRRTDYIHLKWALPFSYYEEAIIRAKPNRVFIVTDDEKDFFFMRFRKFKPIFFCGTPVEQIDFMTRFKKIVISQSSFSWWGAFLGDAQEVYCPVPIVGVWSEEFWDRPKLIPENTVFKKITCFEEYEHGKMEELYHSIFYQRFIKDFWRRSSRKLLKTFLIRR